MRAKCIPSIRAAVAVIAAFLLLSVPALAGNLSHELGVGADSGDSGGSGSVRNFDAAPRLTRSDAGYAAILDTSESDRPKFFSPVAVGKTVNSTNTDLFDIRDATLLGRIGGGVDLDPMEMIGPVSDGTMAYGNLGSSLFVGKISPVPNLSNTQDDRPAVIKWIYSLLKAVGINERCDDPDGCGNRVAVKELR